MNTGLIESWTGSISDIGPIYPFVGTEFWMWIVGLVLWVLWLIWQARNEADEYRDEAEKYTRGENLLKAIRGERIE